MVRLVLRLLDCFCVIWIRVVLLGWVEVVMMWLVFFGEVVMMGWMVNRIVMFLGCWFFVIVVLCIFVWYVCIEVLLSGVRVSCMLEFVLVKLSLCLELFGDMIVGLFCVKGSVLRGLLKW